MRKSNIQADRNSLAEEIITDHQGAKDYSNYLLGRLAKCETFKEARESGRGITPDCDLYQGYAGQSIPPKNYQVLRHCILIVNNLNFLSYTNVFYNIHIMHI